MNERMTATSKTIEYETASCIHCGDEVFIDDDVKNVDDLSEGINVVIGGGKHISISKTPPTARGKEYRVPRMVLKWFGGDDSGKMVQTQYMCPSCAEAVYGFTTPS